MLVFDEALRTVLSSTRRLGSERVELGAAVRRIAAEDVRSDVDMPPFDKSTRDGYACRKADLANELRVVETIAAGCVPRKAIGVNECAKIMTGAMVPQGADCVVMVEFTERPTENSVRFTGDNTDDHISKRGLDLRVGDVVVHKGERIGPQHVGTLACVGCTNPLVACRPRVGVIVTGSELVSPEQKPAGSQIRDSNGAQLVAQVEQLGVRVHDYGVVADIEEDINSVVAAAKADNDVVLICGGVSAGDYDYVPTILRQNGFELLFEMVAVKPGKPTVFGICDGVYCLGLPGNPVSVFVVFELLVKPFLYRLMGHDYQPLHVPAELGQAIRRKDTERMEWIPVIIENDGTVRLVEYHGSAHINALCRANGLIAIDIGVGEIQKGTVIQVRLL